MTNLGWSRAVAVGALTVLVLGTTSAARRSAGVMSLTLSVAPNPVVFAPTTVGGFNYQLVTVSNSGEVGEYIATATPVDADPFFATFAGTCQGSTGPGGAYYVPPSGSCTFQWGFKPSRPGKVTGSGTLSFASGATLNLAFSGKGMPH
jgi:hypothetical protein